MTAIDFIVPGKPVPAARMTQNSTWTKRSQKYLAYKETVGTLAKQAMNEAGLDRFTGPVAVNLQVYLQDRMKRKWDASNVLKALEDGMNTIVYEDDVQITSITMQIFTISFNPHFDTDGSERVRVHVMEVI